MFTVFILLLFPLIGKKNVFSNEVKKSSPAVKSAKNLKLNLNPREISKFREWDDPRNLTPAKLNPIKVTFNPPEIIWNILRILYTLLNHLLELLA